MSDHDVTCCRCKLPIHRDDAVLHMGQYISHNHQRCVELLQSRLDSTVKLKEKLLLDTGKGCSVCGHTPVVNLQDGSGTYWLCGDCVQERLSELQYFRQRSLTQLRSGWHCKICNSSWANSRSEPLHEQWCPHTPATHHTVVVERQERKGLIELGWFEGLPPKSE